MIMNNTFSFRRGLSQVKTGDEKAVRRKLMKVLKINTRTSFCDRKNGLIEPKITEYKAIERVFAAYGIKDIWGDEPVTTKVKEEI